MKSVDEKTAVGVGAPGLVRRTVRGRTHMLSLHAAPLADAAAWMDHYRTFWTDGLALLEQFVAGSHANRVKETPRRKP
ncbi:MAG: hypothetical protein EPN48_02150 [Microbacteriaceae bacterium]|nr:MAG: hypothetical protein EPN48_02150 [Microbacteriaceae bacterium]